MPDPLLCGRTPGPGWSAGPPARAGGNGRPGRAAPRASDRSKTGLDHPAAGRGTRARGHGSAGSASSGRTCSRSGATSTSPGATRISMLVPSSRQERSRRYWPAVSLAEATTTASARTRSSAATASSMPASTGTPSRRRAARPTGVGDAGADDLQAGRGVAAQPAHQVEHGDLPADDDDLLGHRPRACGRCAGGGGAPADAVSARQGGERRAQQDEARQAGEREGDRRRAQQSDREQAGQEHPAELVHAGAQAALGVGTRRRQERGHAARARAPSPTAASSGRRRRGPRRPARRSGEICDARLAM